MNKLDTRLGSDTGLKIKGFESKIFNAECIEVKNIALCAIVVAAVSIVAMQLYGDLALKQQMPTTKSNKELHQPLVESIGP